MEKAKRIDWEEEKVMKREILLRLWNPFSKSYLYDVENVYQCLAQQNIFDGIQESRSGQTPSFDHSSEGMIWEQFIGLTDKNSTKIFEGDKVSGSYLKPYGRCGQQKSIQFTGVVKYKFGQFYVKTGETKDGVDRCVYFSQLWPLSQSSIEIEVKGNIHQECESLNQETNER